MRIRFHRNAYGMHNGWHFLPVSQGFLGLGPIVVYVAWGQSRRLLKEAGY